MKLFRLAQVGGAALLMAAWLIKCHLHQGHWHLNMLLAAAAFLAGTEIGFQIGRAVKAVD
jgi:hypothetical protein